MQPICWLDMREDSNTGDDFFDTMILCVQMGVLQFGDVLIMDNAAVHVAHLNEVVDLLEFFGVSLVFLPVYCSELNGAEYCFNYVKRLLKNHRNTLDFPRAIRDCFMMISHDAMERFYQHAMGINT